MRLPKPLYEVLPYFMIGIGVFFITLVLNRYEHAPTLVAWFAGLICIFGGVFVLILRFVARTKHARNE